MQNKIKNKIQKVRRSILTTLPTYQLTTSKGFTLIETLVAITILLLSITGPLQIAANALLSTYYTRDQITAYYLATEAIEYVKNVRDTTFLEDVFNGGTTPNAYWLHNLEECINGADATDLGFTGCYIDGRLPLSNPDSIKACSSTSNSECPLMRINNNTGIWSYDDATDTRESKFTRYVEIKVLNGGNEAVINVKVTWPSLSLTGAPKVFEINGFIMNWERI
jgi:prepilin-type N-terminal cleavage/methylation domain-containing protein